MSKLFVGRHPRYTIDYCGIFYSKRSSTSGCAKARGIGPVICAFGIHPNFISNSNAPFLTTFYYAG
jgi:hypothetical protein